MNESPQVPLPAHCYAHMWTRKIFGRLLGSYLLSSPHSMSKGITHFIYTLDILLVKPQDIFIRLDIISFFTGGSIKKILYLQNKHCEYSFSPRSWHPNVSVTPASFMNTQPISLLLLNSSSRNLMKEHSTTQSTSASIGSTTSIKRIQAGCKG